jgi:4-amino-4-deoxy-L-arabinose transferase-like glycosyltransferase
MIPLLLLAFLLRTAYLDAQGLWWDEAFSFSISVADPSSIIQDTIRDKVHPPLYYLLMHFWFALGHDEFLLRFFSVLFGVISVSIMYVAASIVGGRQLGVLAALLLAASPFNVWYSQEVRMYSLTTMLTLAAMAAFLRLLRDDTRTGWAAYGMLSLLALYSDYAHLLVTLGQAVFLVVFRTTYRALLRKWICCMALVGVWFLPWAVAMFATGGFYSASISWIPPARPPDLFWTVYSFSVGVTTDPRNLLNVAAALVAIFLAVYGFLTCRRKAGEEQRRIAFVVTWLLLPLLLTFLISLDWPLPQKRSVYIDRFFNPLLPAFLILVANGLRHLLSVRKAVSWAAIGVMSIATVGSLNNLFFGDAYVRDQWREAIADIKTAGRPSDLVLVRPHHYVPMSYYPFDGMDSVTVPYLGSREDYDEFLSSELSPLLNDGDRVWTMIVCENADAHRFAHGARDSLLRKVAADDVRAWLLQHYRLLEERLYNGVYLALYGST